MLNKLICKIERHILAHTHSKPNYLVFESDEHHIFDNSFCLYKFLLEYKKIRMYYVVYNKSEYKEALEKGIKKRNIILISNRINIHHLKNAFYIFRTKKILRRCSLCFISYRNFYKEFKIKFYNDQTMINLRHGEFPIKNVTKYYAGLLFDYDADFYFRVGTNKSIELLPKELKELNCKWFASPMPRNDYLYLEKRNNFKELINKEFVSNKTKYILCMTTFRRDATASYFETQFPLPLSGKELTELNDILSANSVVFMIKVHHDSVVHSIDSDKIKYSNIILLSDEDLERNNLFVNDILQYCDMLITDYSSVLFDYLYFNKPIAFITTDLEDYMSTRGLYNLDFLSIGHNIKAFKDLYNEIINLANGYDDKKTQREEFHTLFNKEDDETGCEKIARLFLNQDLFN